MKRNKRLSAGQKKRRRRKIERKLENIRNAKREILFRKFGNGGDRFELESNDHRPTIEIDESIIADWHEHCIRMKNLLFLKF